MKCQEIPFNFECENQNDDWIDTYFSDNSRKADCRQWVLSVNNKTGEHYALLLRADDEEAPFEHSVTVPRKLVSMLFRSL